MVIPQGEREVPNRFRRKHPPRVHHRNKVAKFRVVTPAAADGNRLPGRHRIHDVGRKRDLSGQHRQIPQQRHQRKYAEDQSKEYPVRHIVMPRPRNQPGHSSLSQIRSLATVSHVRRTTKAHENAARAGSEFSLQAALIGAG